MQSRRLICPVYNRLKPFAPAANRVPDGYTYHRCPHSRIRGRDFLLLLLLLQGNRLCLQRGDLFIEAAIPLFELLHGNGVSHTQLQ